MSLASLIPATRVDPALLPSLLPWSLRYNFLYPYCDLFSHIVPTKPGPPPWNGELEAYYRTFDTQVWYLLGHDHDTDTYALEKLRSRQGELKRRKRKKEHGEGVSLADLEAAIAAIQSHIVVRWSKLLGLHEIRLVFLEPLEKLHHSYDDFYLMRKVLPSMRYERPIARPYSLWPISARVPHYCDRKKRVCLWHDGVNWTKYALPDRPSPDSEAARRRFEPTAAEVLEDADESAESGWAEATMGDATVPLLLSHSNGPRSSGFIPAFTGLLHRRHPQVA